MARTSPSAELGRSHTNKRKHCVSDEPATTSSVQLWKEIKGQNVGPHIFPDFHITLLQAVSWELIVTCPRMDNSTGLSIHGLVIWLDLTSVPLPKLNKDTS